MWKRKIYEFFRTDSMLFPKEPSNWRKTLQDGNHQAYCVHHLVFCTAEPVVFGYIICYILGFGMQEAALSRLLA